MFPMVLFPRTLLILLNRKSRGANYRLDEGRLHGRISQIATWEKGENYNVLYIRGRAEEGLLQYAPKVPSFNGISGTLELKGKDFILHSMTGKFGDAPFQSGRKTGRLLCCNADELPFHDGHDPNGQRSGLAFRQ